ncbi:MAG TPA: nitroreductase/quinone reductase family protein [Acidimicrobiia bacterium]
MPEPRVLAIRAFTAFHRLVFRATNGRIGSSGFGMPVLELTTVGRRSGARRSTMLTSPVQDGDTLVLVASYGGRDHHPAWFLNLRDNPDVDVTMQGRVRPMRARVATAGEKVELWPRVVEAYRGYAQYQTRTERDIPLVIVEPRPTEETPHRSP